MGLIERDEEMAALKGLLAGAVLGQGKIALVGGGVATGKSELLHAFAEQAIELGALAITATGSRMERDLELGVLGQLVHDAPLTAGDRERALALLQEGVRATAPPGTRQGVLRQVDPQVVHGLCTILLELSERCPLVIAVDDVHHADHASLLCLSHLCRRVRLARIMAVFSHSGQVWHGGAFIHELLRQPHCHRFRLAPLSRDGVVSAVRERVGRVAAERFAEEWAALSGGNPLLAAALAEDYRESVRSGPGERGVVPGDRYAQAVLSCLHRGEPRTLRVARGLAVLGSADLLARLLGIGPADVTRELHALTVAGLLGDGRFRHESARAAVLADMDADERAAMHGRAAEAAHDAGAAPAVIAAHLLEAGRADAPWAVPVLEEAARAALRDGRADAAVAQLTLARRACRDEQRRARITALLLRAQWRIDPGATPALLAELAEAERRGTLRGSDAVALARALLWHGRVEDARAVLGRLGEAAACAAGCDCGTADELFATRLWLRATHPPLRTPPGHGARGPAAAASAATSRRLESGIALVEVLSGGPPEEELDALERILQSCRLDEMSMDTVENALLALTYAGRCDGAAPWCEAFMAEASSRRAPVWHARLTALRAEIAIRQGDMPLAERHARLALEILPPAGWGVVVGGPLSSLIIAATATGRHEEAREHLRQPVPDAMFQTRYGLLYLHARGRHSLACDRPALALRDFRLCGELMETWDVDVPGLVPWRAEAAEACARMGRPDRARELAEAQLARRDPGSARAHGMATRVLASLAEVWQRPAMLRQAADLLEKAGDKYELARALSDFVAACDALGRDTTAAVTGTGTGPAAGERPAGAPAASVLSDAERRVAALAAAGYTNREIAGKLFITVSTVEQHLTRTYRKLNISRRADLPTTLRSGDHAVV